MDTPGRRATRSQMSTLGPSSAGKHLGSRAVGSAKKKELPRPPFTDLTNDSPIAGLMPAKLTASAGSVYESTPRSKLRPAERPIGEDLLRMQVTSLLRKVELEALLHNKKEALSYHPDLFESPMRLAAPTPANTPATGVSAAQEMRAKILPAIVVASPICQSDSSKLERISPALVSTAEPLSSVEETCAAENRATVEQPTTRTLKFDSPERQVLGIEGVSQSTPASVSTEEILSSIEETSGSPNTGLDGNIQELATRALQFCSPSKHVHTQKAHIGNRTIRFESPQRSVPDADIVSELFSPSAHPHPRSTATEDSEDSWSVIVNINSPEKLEVGGDHDLVDVPTTFEVEAEKMDFLQNVPVDPETTPRITIPIAVWERRDTPARRSGLKDDDFEDCEEEYDDDYEEQEEYEEEAYVDGTDTIDEACEELCKGISTISMGGESRGLPVFKGKHTRFTYNSDDEIEEEEVVTDKTVNSPSKLRLQGLPTPKGSHIRFNAEAEMDEDN